MSDSIETTLGRVSGGEDLSFDEMSTTIDAIMRGEWPDEQIGLLLTALRTKGEAVSEVAGAAAALRKHMTPIRTSRGGLLDTCGTGGDASDTFNISTAAALVTAAAGVPVAKHGNRSFTSKSGSADVLKELGVNIDATVEQVESCLDVVGICFCFAPLLHPAMKHVSAVRKQLGVPTIFNLLGPLANPAGAEFQLLGVGQAPLRPLLAAALAMLGTRRALVVCGDDGLDEVSLAAPTQVTEVIDGQLHEFTWQPEQFGMQTTSLDAIKVEGPADSAAMIRRVLDGESGPARDIVVLNAAAALLTAGLVDNPHNAASLAAIAIDSGATNRILERLVQHSHAKA